MSTRCKGIMRDGSECHIKQVDEDGYCRHHQNQKKQAVSEEPEMQETIEKQVDKSPAGEKVESAAKDKYALAAERRRRVREARKRLGGVPGQKLLATKRPGFVRRWANDEANNLEEMLDRGYTFVEDRDTVIPSTDVGERKSQHVGVKTDGSGLRAYLMEIPEEFYEEDQKEKEAEIRKVEQQTRRAKVGGDKGIGQDQSVLYDPSKGNNQLFED